VKTQDSRRTLTVAKELLDVLKVWKQGEIIRLLNEKEKRMLTDRGQAHANEAAG
jgi:hypothetical protein